MTDSLLAYVTVYDGCHVCFQLTYILFDLRQVTSNYPMKVVQNIDAAVDCPEFPLVLRKGRNTLAMMCGHKDSIKKFFDTCHEAFTRQLERNSLTRPSSLALCLLAMT